MPTINANRQGTASGTVSSNFNTARTSNAASVSDGNSVTATIVGGTATQSGLTPGSAYYVQRDGTISTDPATPEVKVGIALSATSLLVK